MNNRHPHSADAATLVSIDRKRRHAILGMGLLQGVIVWALINALSHLDGASTLLWALLYAAWTLPLAWYLTEGIEVLPTRRRFAIVAGFGLIAALLGAYNIWVWEGRGDIFPDQFPHLLGCAVLGFTALPLIAHARRGPGLGLSWHYPDLFQTAWRNAVMMAVAAALTGVFWIVLWAGAMMMSSIGLPLMTDLITRPLFALPATTLAVSAAFVLALTRGEFIVSLRRFWLSMNQIFLPLLLLFAVMWVVAVPFTGLAPLLDTQYTAMAMLWFTALAIKFANTARQDGLGAPPYTPLLRRILVIAWLALPVIVAIGGWAMYQRIAQHGWTQDRVWGAFVLALAACYVLGYAASVRQGRRSWLWSVDHTNIAVAVLMCLGLLALLTPLADARRIAVASQIDRLEHAAVAEKDFDYGYLARESGRYGRQALQRLADDAHRPQIAAAARDALSSKSRTAPSDEQPMLTDAQALKKWRVLPDGAVLEPSTAAALLAWLHAKERNSDETLCLRAIIQCELWPVDLDNDGNRELVLISGTDSWSQALVLESTDKTGALRLEGRIAGIDRNWLDAIAQNRTVLAPPRWREIEKDGLRLRVDPVPPNR